MYNIIMSPSTSYVYFIMSSFNIIMSLIILVEAFIYCIINIYNPFVCLLEGRGLYFNLVTQNL